MDTQALAVPPVTGAPVSFASGLENLLGGKSTTERKRALLKPRKLINALRQRLSQAASPEFYLRAAEAVLALRCDRNITTPLDATDNTPAEGLRTRTLDQDREFRDNRHRLDDDRCLLLHRYAELDYHEIAVLLDLSDERVYDLTDGSFVWSS